MSECAIAQPQRTNTTQEATKAPSLSQRWDLNQPEPTTLQEWLFDTASGAFAEPRFGYDFSRLPALTGMKRQTQPVLRTQSGIQRFPKDEDEGFAPCLTYPEAGSPELSAGAEPIVEGAEPASNTAPTQTEAEATTEGPAPEETPATGFIVEDTIESLGPGQMRKSEFLAKLRTEVTSAAEAALSGTGRTTAECPYLEYWFSYYSWQDSPHLERAIRRYAPETAHVTTARDYIPIIVERVRRSVKTWAKTGEITGIPEGLSMGMLGRGLLGGIGGLISGIGGIFFKAREGGARPIDDPQAVQKNLGEGQPLEGAVRSRMESAFGRDFSHVRTHTDTTAAGLSNRLNARAFTIGKHIAFGSGEYRPGTLFGDALIAHEMAHVVQQSRESDSVAHMEAGNVGYDTLEKDADRTAAEAVASIWQRTVGVASNLARETMPCLRSGIRLQRCAETRRSESPASIALTNLCPTTINNDTTLTRDCSNGIALGADNITLDGGGHTLTGPGDPRTDPRAINFGIGILLNGRTGVNVRNCRVTNFSMGVALRNSRRNTFTDVRALNSTRDGFDLNDSNENVFTRILSTGNVLNGIELDRCHGNTFIGCTVNSNDDGFDLNNSNENIFTGNNANNNRRDGFRIVQDSNTNTFMRNIARDNQRDGFRIDDNSDGNTFNQNTASNNSSDDFDLRSGTGNTCNNNVFANPRARNQCPPDFR